MADEIAELQSALTDHYRFDRELGRGGMAVVYLAHAGDKTPQPAIGGGTLAGGTGSGDNTRVSD